MTLVYESKSKEWAAQPKICNTNNHPSDITPMEYRERIALTYKDKWVSIFPDPKGTIVIPVSNSQCHMLLSAAYVGAISGHRPEMFEDELNIFETYIAKVLPLNKKWFIRFNEVSPKDGVFGCGPVTSAKEVVTSIITSMRAYRALLTMYETNRGDILYLIPWRADWNDALEFRVFVHNGKVTAFSQYIWLRDIGWKLDSIQLVAPEIVKYCTEAIIPKMSVPSFVVDLIVVVSDPKYSEGTMIPTINAETNFHIELVEFNSFGADLASGSALFHWLNDKDILYGNGDTITVRFITA